MKLHEYTKINIPDLTDKKETDPSKIKALIVTIDATHGGYINGNYFFYVPQGMRKYTNTWIEPYNKPIIREHTPGASAEGDPIGRVIKAEYIGDDKKGKIRLTCRVTDKDAIEKIMDGRLSTVSVGSTPVDKVECSVCGKNILETRCGHKRSKVYKVEVNDDGKTEDRSCFWYIHGASYYELSFTYRPADVNDKTKEVAIVTDWKIEDSKQPIDVIEPLESKNLDTNELVLTDAIVKIENEPGTSLVDTFNYAGSLLKENEHLLKDVEIKDNGDLGSMEIKVQTAKLVDGSDTYNSHAHYYRVDAAGNGETNYVDGHSHEIVDGVIQKTVTYDNSWETKEYHDHAPEGERELTLDTFYTKHLTGYSKNKDVKKHKHVIVKDFQGNGHATYANGHTHRIINDNLLVSTGRGEDVSHNHTIENSVLEDSTDLKGIDVKSLTDEDLLDVLQVVMDNKDLTDEQKSLMYDDLSAYTRALNGELLTDNYRYQELQELYDFLGFVNSLTCSN